MIPKYNSKEFLDRIKRIEKLWSALADLSEMAAEFDIDDIFQDNGAKVLQQLVYLNFDNLKGREGNDAVSADGKEWEMKSLNRLKVTGFSTNHHTTHDIIAKYRQVPWSFAVYAGINLEELYVMAPEALEPQFRHMEESLKEKEALKEASHLNNPKIPLKFVQEKGILVYSNKEGCIMDPIVAVAKSSAKAKRH